jgi:hypothetical protein
MGSSQRIGSDPACQISPLWLGVIFTLGSSLGPDSPRGVGLIREDQALCRSRRSDPKILV